MGHSEVVWSVCEGATWLTHASILLSDVDVNYGAWLISVGEWFGFNDILLAWVIAGRFDMCCVMRALKSLDRVRWGQVEKKQDEIGEEEYTVWYVKYHGVTQRNILCSCCERSGLTLPIILYISHLKGHLLVSRCISIFILLYTFSLKYACEGSTLFGTLPPDVTFLFLNAVLGTPKETKSSWIF